MSNHDFSLLEHYPVVLVPGIQDSVAEHWQSCWQRRFPHWLRISQRDWQQPDLEGWLLAICRELEGQTRPVLLIGHSFGALSSWAFAQRYPQRVAGVVLVAPAEPQRFELEDEILPEPLSVPGLMFASRSDPLLNFSRAKYWSAAWNCPLVDVGDAGHINAQSGFGEWLHALDCIAEFVQHLPARK